MPAVQWRSHSTPSDAQARHTDGSRRRTIVSRPLDAATQRTKMNARSFFLGLPLAAVALFISSPAPAQLSYSKGQSVYTAYEGWRQNADGSYQLLFGYMNSNWEEEFDVPIGPDNDIEPGGPDQGQPTHFFPRRNRYVFVVNVPKDFGKKEVVWTLTTHGKTSKAYATLAQDYFLDNMVLTSETG